VKKKFEEFILMKEISKKDNFQQETIFSKIYRNQCGCCTCKFVVFSVSYSNLDFVYMAIDDGSFECLFPLKVCNLEQDFEMLLKLETVISHVKGGEKKEKPSNMVVF
jgi:hypothetical protein